MDGDVVVAVVEALGYRPDEIHSGLPAVSAQPGNRSSGIPLDPDMKRGGESDATGR